MSNKPQLNFPQLLQAMSIPDMRNQYISQIPQPLQRLFTDRNYQYEIVGQDGTQAFVDYQNHITQGTPIPDASKEKLMQLREKLLGMIENKPVII